MLVLLLFLAGCKETVYSRLEEQEANEMLVVLAQAGIPSRKRGEDADYSVEVDAELLPLAVETLKRAGFPRERFASLGEMFKREGIVSTPTEERVRFLHGVSQELSNTLSAIDGVTNARVHIVLPQVEPGSNRTSPSSASVFIKHGPDVDLQPMLPSIKSLVMRSVEGLGYDNVFVSLFPSAPVPIARVTGQAEPLFGVRLPASDAPWLNALIAAAIALPILLFGWLAFHYRRAYRRSERMAEHLRKSAFGQLADLRATESSGTASGSSLGSISARQPAAPAHFDA